MKKYKPRKANSKKFELRKRKSARERGYDSRWTKYRFRFLYHNPKCYVCADKSKVVDHIKAHKGDEDLFWNENNYMPLCKRCHDRITGMFDRKDVPDLDGKIKWIRKERERNQVNIKIKVVPLQ